MILNVDKITRARQAGIVIPVLAYRAARKVGITYVVACSLLEQESGGGRNVWGHDPTWMIGYPVLNADTYGVYKAHRGGFGNQGVGPCQLTSPSLQDEADARGGCWKPWPNLLVGFGVIRSYLDQGLSYHDTWVRYNGSDSYAVQMDARVQKWKKILA